MIQTALLEFAEADNVVQMGRGGSWLLRGIPHVLPIRITAPFDQRVKNWIRRMSELTGETPNPRAARDMVKREVVTLEGTAALEPAVEVARGVPGVRAVKAQQLEIPPIPPFVA